MSHYCHKEHIEMETDGVVDKGKINKGTLSIDSFFKISYSSTTYTVIVECFVENFSKKFNVFPFY